MLAAAVVLVVVVLVGLKMNEDQRRAWAQRSGSASVEVVGQIETDEVTVRFAFLETDAEHELTTLRLHVDRKPDTYNRNPPVVVEFAGMTCQKLSSRLWSAEVRNVMELSCSEYVELDQLGEVGSGAVRFAR